MLLMVNNEDIYGVTEPAALLAEEWFSTEGKAFFLFFFFPKKKLLFRVAIFCAKYGVNYHRLITLM